MSEPPPIVSTAASLDLVRRTSEISLDGTHDRVRPKPDNQPLPVGDVKFGDNEPTNGLEATQCCHPFNFLLTKVADIPKIYNASGAIGIKDLLSTSMGQLERSAQFNFLIDIPWLVKQYPEEFRTKPLLIVHGFQRLQKSEISEEASVFPHIRLCQAKLPIPYGCHHTKMMLLLYDNGLRVVVHTANLKEIEWLRKTQGIWVSPLFIRSSPSSSADGDSSTHFKRDLIEYLSAYKCPLLDPLLEEWINNIKAHDMSTAKVHIIGSSPGRHTGTTMSAFGHLKLRKVLENSGPDIKLVQNWSVIGQFSSIASLGPRSDSWLCGEWLQSLEATRGGMPSPRTAPKPQLIFPSVENVRESLEGYPAGKCLSYYEKNAKKQSYLCEFLHQWRSEIRCRTGACPHIKTYTRVSEDSNHIAWFLLTSANLSKAAWGALEMDDSQLMIRSYELGVLFLPQTYGSAATFQPWNVDNCQQSNASELRFPLPYDLPLCKYTTEDEPWVSDIPHVDKPDTHGNTWSPCCVWNE